MTWERFWFVSAGLVATIRFIDWRWPIISKRLKSSLIDLYFWIEPIEGRLVFHKIGCKVHTWLCSRGIIHIALLFYLLLLLGAVVNFMYTHPSGTLREVLLGPQIRYNLLGGDPHPILGSQLLALVFGLGSANTSIMASVYVTRKLFRIILRFTNPVICFSVMVVDTLAAVVIGLFGLMMALDPFFTFNWAYPNGSFIHSVAIFGGLGSLLVSAFYIILLVLAIIAHIPIAPGLKQFLLGTIDRLVSVTGGLLTLVAFALTVIIGLLKLAVSAG